MLTTCKPQITLPDEGGYPYSWTPMSEADRVFSRQSSRATSSSQTRHIVTAPRKNRSGTVTSRVVEVVHVVRRTSGSDDDQPASAPWNAGQEAWPDGLHAKPSAPSLPQVAQPTPCESQPPIVHVMPAWEPSVQQLTSPTEKPVNTPNSAQAVKVFNQRDAKPRSQKGMVRHFADPFADGDDGTNCIRCGYLVEHNREARGLWTCAKCS